MTDCMFALLRNELVRRRCGGNQPRISPQVSPLLLFIYFHKREKNRSKERLDDVSLVGTACRDGPVCPRQRLMKRRGTSLSGEVVLPAWNLSSCVSCCRLVSTKRTLEGCAASSTRLLRVARPLSKLHGWTGSCWQPCSPAWKPVMEGGERSDIDGTREGFLLPFSLDLSRAFTFRFRCRSQMDLSKSQAIVRPVSWMPGHAVGALEWAGKVQLSMGEGNSRVGLYLCVCVCVCVSKVAFGG